MIKRSDQFGFTLIELMVVVAIVAILAAIAYPAYTSQVTKTRRAEAKEAISDVAQRMERCYTRFNAYNNAACPSSGNNIQSENGYYQITVSPRTATAFTLKAVPKGIQASNDKKCGTFTLTQAGVRGMEASGSVVGSVNDCW